jgi:uncharacterized protein (TIGR00297 family)
MFFVTFLVVEFALLQFSALDPIRALPIAVACALFVTATESVSPSDADNMTIPLMCALIIHLMLPLSLSGTLVFCGKTAIALAVALASWRAGFLNFGGAIGVFLIGAIIFAIGGLAWIIPIIVFFVSSSLISLWRKERKNKLRAYCAKSGPRDIKQVLAKGGIPCLLAIWFSVTADPRLYFAYLCSLAAANADTWASEIGFFSRRTPVSIVNWKPVTRGASGGVSATGYVAAGLGALVIGLTGLPFYADGHMKTVPILLALVSVAGVFACTVDSVLGAIAQAKLRCPRCGEITENPNHCEESVGILDSGKMWINNEVVNLACALTGAVFAIAVASNW